MELGVGSYGIVKPLASGGMGDVFLAEHAATGTSAVIKIAHHADDEAFNVAEREWRALTSISSPHVVRGFERHILPDGRRAVVMQYVDGTNVSELLGSLLPEQAITLAIAVAAGACALHEAGIVHRDIKPSNVIVPRDGNDLRPDRAIIIDLGLAQFSDDAPQEPGTIIGTASFMAPEQLTAGDVTAATDVWSIGALLYQALYGRGLFKADRAFDLIVKTVRTDVHVPEHPRVPDPLRIVLQTALQRDPQKRYRNACELYSALQRAQLAARRITDVSRARRPIRSNRRTSIVLLSSSWAALSTACVILALRASTLTLQLAAIIIALVLMLIVLVLLRKRKRAEIHALQGIGYLMVAVGGRERLTESLAIHVDEIYASCRRADEKILGTSLALFVNEFVTAPTSADRRAILTAMTDVVDKLERRLAPWYVRYEKAIAALVAMTGTTPIIIAALKAFRLL